MGICSRRHFLLTICSLQLITTIERQVFDFLGFMWAPILVNFFNIIFVILGFFGAFQYRPKYIISYCVWNTLWLGWNIFAICFYLDVGISNKESNILNFGTGSFSWWYTNGPGCKVAYEITEPDIYKPLRPNVTDCILDYEIIEVLHASTQCILGLVAFVGGICLSRVFLEEDDSFDFVGGGDFGLAGHTPLHPMYVSYSALPPPVYPSINSAKSQNNRDNTMSTQRSYALSDDDNKKLSLTKLSNCQDIGNNRIGIYTERRIVVDSDSMTARIDNVIVNNDTNDRVIDDDYSCPKDRVDRSTSPCEDYDTLDETSRARFRLNEKFQNSKSSRYSPVVTPRMRRSRFAANSRKNNVRNSSYKPRIFIDHIREQPLRSFYSDPRLSIEQRSETINRAKRDSRPLSLYANNS